MVANRRGTALIITLMIVSLLTVLLVGFLASMRLEMRASAAYEDTQRTKMVAKAALSHAIDLIRSNIPDPAGIEQSELTAPGRHWVVNPGRLTLVDEDGNPTYIPLHTGEAEGDPESEEVRDAETVDLNEPLPGEVVPPITYGVTSSGDPDPSLIPEMRVKWVPVLRDPSEAASEENRMVGRYAFWMDDECAKINFNLAHGKPAPGADADYDKQFRGGMQPPLFKRGYLATEMGSARRTWALGKPQSVNLDVLAESPSDIDVDSIHDHSFLHGFSRYPEAILNYVRAPDAEGWFHRWKFNLTHYNRAPEFNAFGRPRLFLTYIPLATEAGPYYQHPFIWDPDGAPNLSGNEVIHLSALMGSIGFHYAYASGDPEIGSLPADAMVTLQNFNMLRAYMERRWPGYGASFAEKYGRREAAQIALNMLMVGRMATTMIATGVTGFTNDWAFRSTSVNHNPGSAQRPGNNPERFYWTVDVDGEEVQMLPQVPGPHITEVRVVFQPEAVSATKYAIGYRLEAEFYMHPFGPRVDISRLPMKTDYLEFQSTGAGVSKFNQYGPKDPSDKRDARNWNHSPNMGKLRAAASGNLGPAGNGQGDANRKMGTTPKYYLGTSTTAVPVTYKDANPVEDRQLYDITKGQRVTIDFKFRVGMSMASAEERPRQMIPLGETLEDTLGASVVLDLSESSPKIVSWEIVDPCLSHIKERWRKFDTENPETGEVGSPGEPNTDEPAEDSPEKSKFRFIQRSPGGSIAGVGAVDRPDEYNTRSRVASKGYFSFIRTGMQTVDDDGIRGVKYRFMNLGPAAKQTANPPDHAMLELFGPTYPMAHNQWRVEYTLPDEFSTPSFMQSTAGQVNVNTRIYPRNAWFEAPERRKPLEAVFKHLRSDAEIARFVSGISDLQTDTQFFRYPGEIANASGYESSGDQPFKDEELLRNMAGCLTTQSNTFGVWGVAQTVKKSARNEKYDRYERGDSVLGEKRFFAVVERYVWPGKDGVPGNAHVDSSGKWDRIAKQRAEIRIEDGDTDTLFHLPGSPPLRRTGDARLELDREQGTYPEMDGPQQVGMHEFAEHALGKVVWRHSSLEDAYNPPQPVIKYRVNYFKYLDN